MIIYFCFFFLLSLLHLETCARHSELDDDWRQQLPRYYPCYYYLQKKSLFCQTREKLEGIIIRRSREKMAGRDRAPSLVTAPAAPSKWMLIRNSYAGQTVETSRVWWSKHRRRLAVHLLQLDRRPQQQATHIIVVYHRNNTT